MSHHKKSRLVFGGVAAVPALPAQEIKDSGKSVSLIKTSGLFLAMVYWASCLKIVVFRERTLGQKACHVLDADPSQAEGTD